MTQLLDDQPANRAGDKLRFDRMLTVIQTQVLERNSNQPFVVGLFGRWGSGKSTLLGMLGQRLAAENHAMLVKSARRRFRPKCRLRHIRRLPRWMRRWRIGRYLRGQRRRITPWVIVPFSPWVYRHEKTLLLPLLAAVAKETPIFQKLVKSLIKSGPELVKMLGDMGAEFAKSYGLPLLGFLQTLNQGKQEELKDLVDRIKAAVDELVTDGNSRRSWCRKHTRSVEPHRKVIFLIDDLDRCHDHAQIVGLLEQIKLFLHLPNCLFFIAADKSQIVHAIEQQFPDEGQRYLEKFVQLAIELPQPDAAELINLLPGEFSAPDRDRLVRAARVLDHNPRKVKALWNRAQTCLALMNQDADHPASSQHTPNLALVLRWLLLQEAGVFQDNPYAYLEVEQALGSAAATPQNFAAKFSAGLTKRNALSLPNTANPGMARTQLLERIKTYLWQDSEIAFGSPGVLAWYIRASGSGFSNTRDWLEQRYYAGQKNFAGLILVNEDLSNIRLNGVCLRNARFYNCQMKRADLSHSNLGGVAFFSCALDKARFDGCNVKHIRADQKCTGLDTLNTDAVTYQHLLDALLAP